MINEVLHSFISVADKGSFNKAAERLSISTPAVMKQMNALEKSVGVELFHRTNQGITLTEAGKSFYHDARAILRYTRKAMEKAQIAAGQAPRPGACSARKRKDSGCERRSEEMTHEKFEIPQDEEGRKRYESAKKHAELAKEAGKSVEEIHEIFKKVMEGKGVCGAKSKCTSKNYSFTIPEDEEGRKRYESARKHARLAEEAGKSSEEVHEIFRKVMEGKGTCGGKSKCTCKDKTFEIPQDEEGRKRYESARKHARLAEEAGKSSEEVHEIFRKVMEGKGTCGGKSKCTCKDKTFEIPQDEEGRKRYESARKHARLAEEAGKSSEEVHDIFKKVMEGKGVCGGKRKCTAKEKTFEIPEDEEGKKRYQSAMRHVESARKEGKSGEELHELFKKVMEGTGKCRGRKTEEK